MPEPQTQFFTPLTSFVFQYSFPMAFVGSIMYAITSSISVDMASIITNKNITVILNIIIGLSGLFSIFVWWNLPLPDNGFFIDKKVKSNISS